MIFSDKKTAHEVREEAERQLIEWLYDQNKSLLSAVGLTRKLIEGDITNESLHNNAEASVQKLPSLVATLLYRSGMIEQDENKGREGQEPHYPVILYYDDDLDHDSGVYGHKFGKITKAMDDNPGRLIGGMVDGRIHT